MQMTDDVLALSPIANIGTFVGAAPTGLQIFKLRADWIKETSVRHDYR